jgi:hypothetical protein
MTAQGHPRTVSAHAIEHGNLVAAEFNARMMGQVSLVEALELTALVALKDPQRRSLFAGRLLTPLLSERRERRSRMLRSSSRTSARSAARGTQFTPGRVMALG